MEKRTRDLGRMIEIIVVIMLGVTALLTAWATWIGSLHGGNQATNYTVSNNLAAEGNSEYNAGVQNMMQDMLLWNEVSDLQIDIFSAQDRGDADEVDRLCYKLYFKLNDNLSEEMAKVLKWEQLSDNPTVAVQAWLSKDEALLSPFDTEGFGEHYFASANALLEQSHEKLEEGKQDSGNGDTYGLVTVIYGVVLFLLGINSTIKGCKNKIALTIISLTGFVIVTVFMFTISMPTGFSITSFFGG